MRSSSALALLTMRAGALRAAARRPPLHSIAVRAGSDNVHAPWSEAEDAVVWAARGSPDLAAVAARLGRKTGGVARRLEKLETPRSAAAARLFGAADETETAEADPLRFDDAALLAACRVDYRRDSGPGGQKRNKVESAVRLTHEATGVVANAADDRSQRANRNRALRRLRFAIAHAVRAPVDLGAPREPDADVDGALPWTRGARVGAKSDGRPRAERAILDVLDAAAGSVSVAATYLGGTTGQLSKVLVKDDALLTAANRVRATHGLGPLKRRK